MQIDWHKYKKIVLLSGAGISAGSGIKTFRDSNGLWEEHRIEDVATPEAFENNPHLVWSFYSLRRHNAGEAKPNQAHLALDEFAKRYHGEITLITQNVDSLHQRAARRGHLDPICMHGSLEKSRCTHCQHIWLDDRVWISQRSPYSAGILSDQEKASPECLERYQVSCDDSGLPLSPCCQALLRPHIVWFGEEPLYLPRIFKALSECDLFASIGTSGVVYPAAGFLRMAKSHGATTLVFNTEEIDQSELIDYFIQGPAEKTIPQYFD
jgi:NAD-dependent deacetylase